MSWKVRRDKKTGMWVARQLGVGIEFRAISKDKLDSATLDSLIKRDPKTKTTK